MNVEQAVKSRISVRSFDPTKKVSKEDIEKILDAGRLAPNGLGFEAWTFTVVESKLPELMEASMNQKHVADASFAIVLSAPTQEFLENNTEVLAKQLRAVGYDEARVEGSLRFLGENKGQYVREQTFFAAAQMMLQAAGLGIGSNALGGYVNDAVCAVINVDPKDEQVTLVIPFGYELNETPHLKKKPLSEIVRYI